MVPMRLGVADILCTSGERQRLHPDNHLNRITFVKAYIVVLYVLDMVFRLRQHEPCNDQARG